MIIDDITLHFAEKGDEPYAGEKVTQLEHALQTAALAEAEGAESTLIAAALLHDLGHMISPPSDARTQDDLHQFRALPSLRPHFPDAVLEPIRLHVDAKRFLCGTDPEYFLGLSPASVNSLRLQGGPFSPSDAKRFLDLPFAREAVRLRRWDDAAKVPERRTPVLQHFLRIVSNTVTTRA